MGGMDKTTSLANTSSSSPRSLSKSLRCLRRLFCGVSVSKALERLEMINAGSTSDDGSRWGPLAGPGRCLPSAGERLAMTGLLERSQERGNHGRFGFLTSFPSILPSLLCSTSSTLSSSP